MSLIKKNQDARMHNVRSRMILFFFLVEIYSIARSTDDNELARFYNICTYAREKATMSNYIFPKRLQRALPSV